MKRTLLLIALAILVFSLLSVARKSKENRRITRTTPRLVLLYATCSLNKDYLAPYKSGIEYTPNFADFADQSVVFLKHRTEVGFSGPAFATLFTGSYVYHHGIYFHPDVLNDKNYLIAEAFRDNGYETFFWNGNGMASAALNYAQGVRQENISHKTPFDGSTLTRNDPVFTSILKRLKSDSKYKAFVQLNFTETHIPYSLYSDIKTTQAFCHNFPNECPGVTDADIAKYLPIHQKNFGRFVHHFDETVKTLNLTPSEVQQLARVLEATYKSCVHLLDTHFGKTLQAMKSAGVLEKSLIVFTSDHGEILYRKNSSIKWGHWGLEPEVLSIPLMIRLPGSSNKRIDYTNATGSVDVFPTIAGLSNLKISKDHRLDGYDLSGAILGEESAPRLLVYSFHGLPHPADVVTDVRNVPVEAVSGDTVYLLQPKKNGHGQNFRILNLEGTPVNVAEATLAKLNRSVTTSLIDYRTHLIQNYSSKFDQSEKKEILERLKSLGYLQ